jgi:hypothetical protein
VLLPQADRIFPGFNEFLDGELQIRHYLKLRSVFCAVINCIVLSTVELPVLLLKCVRQGEQLPSLREAYFRHANKTIHYTPRNRWSALPLVRLTHVNFQKCKNSFQILATVKIKIAVFSDEGVLKSGQKLHWHFEESTNNWYMYLPIFRCTFLDIS